MTNKKMVCIECQEETTLEAVTIKEQAIVLDGRELWLTYFQCPHCNIVYFVTLVDKVQFDEWQKQANQIRSKIMLLGNKANPKYMKKLENDLSYYQKKIDEHIAYFKKKYNSDGFIEIQNKIYYKNYRE